MIINWKLNFIKLRLIMKTRIFTLLAAMLLTVISAFAQSNAPLKGDVNGDGRVDVADIANIIDIMAKGEAGYFYFGTVRPTAENYTSLPGVVGSYTSIAEASGATATIAVGETLYMLCPASWMEGKTVEIEDEAGNPISFLEEKDVVTISGYVIYRTQVLNDEKNVVLKTGDPEPIDILSVTPTEIDFGKVELGTDQTKSFTVTNTGDTNISFSVLHHRGLIDVSDVNEAITLEPHASKEFTITAHGMKRGSVANSRIDIRVNNEEDIKVPSINVHFEGWDSHPLTLATNSITLAYEEEATVDIVYGSLKYELVSDDDHLFTAFIGTLTTGGGGRYETSSSSTSYIRINAKATAEKATLRVKDLDTGEEATLDVTVGSFLGAEAIDLGMPSGTRWASYNVSATKPEEFGGK